MCHGATPTYAFGCVDMKGKPVLDHIRFGTVNSPAIPPRKDVSKARTCSTRYGWALEFKPGSFFNDVYLGPTSFSLQTTLHQSQLVSCAWLTSTIISECEGKRPDCRQDEKFRTDITKQGSKSISECNDLYEPSEDKGMGRPWYCLTREPMSNHALCGFIMRGVAYDCVGYLHAKDAEAARGLAARHGDPNEVAAQAKDIIPPELRKSSPQVDLHRGGTDTKQSKVPITITDTGSERTVSQEEHSVSWEEESISEKEQPVSDKEESVSWKEESIAKEEKSVSDKVESVSKEEKSVSDNEESVSKEGTSVSVKEQSVSKEGMSVSVKEQSVPVDLKPKASPPDATQAPDLIDKGRFFIFQNGVRTTGYACTRTNKIIYVAQESYNSRGCRYGDEMQGAVFNPGHVDENERFFPMCYEFARLALDARPIQLVCTRAVKGRVEILGCWDETSTLMIGCGSLF
ncbi:hypothetical protein CDD81_677 [Ophiocordyceps australis]|uniref:Uncharacterized protein n=1 Tax=Ophiocordyceps australis TaxID=1399860 RepID=A0A2C5Y0J8_9HYPO|nr:hypothetical protein CDD81_677 [Ophiocordyceps australis]